MPAANNLKEQSRTDNIRLEKRAVVGHVVLVGGLMKHHVYTFQGLFPRALVSDIAVHEPDVARKGRLRRPSVHPGFRNSSWKKQVAYGLDS